MEAKLNVPAPPAHPIAPANLPRSGEFVGHAVRSLPAGAAQSAALPLAQDADRDAIPSLYGPLRRHPGPSEPQARERMVAGYIKAFGSALRIGGPAALKRACAAIAYDGAGQERCANALRAAMIVTAPDGVAAFQRAARGIAATRDDAWGGLLARLWQDGQEATRAQASSGAAGAAVPRSHLLACLGAALQVDEAPGVHLKGALDAAPRSEQGALACDALEGLVQGGTPVRAALGIVLRAWDGRPLPRLLAPLLAQVDREEIRACIDDLMAPAPAGRRPVMSLEEGAEALVALAFAPGDDGPPHPKQLERALSWLAGHASPDMMACVLDELFEVVSTALQAGFAAPGDSAAISGLRRMIEATAPRLNPAMLVSWLMLHGEIVERAEGKSPREVFLPPALRHWEGLAQACRRDPLSPRLLGREDLSNEQKALIAFVALREGRWTPAESAAQLRSLVAVDLDPCDRMDLMIVVLRGSAAGAGDGLFEQVRAQAVRQWCIVAEGADGADGPVHPVDPSVQAAGERLRDLYICWAQKQGWADGAGGVQRLEPGERAKFRAFVRAEQLALRGPGIHEAQEALDLLEGFAAALEPDRPRAASQ